MTLRVRAYFKSTNFGYGISNYSKQHKNEHYNGKIIIKMYLIENKEVTFLV